MSYHIQFLDFESGEDLTKKRVSWTVSVTKLLLKTYSDMQHQFDNTRIKRSACWDDVATLMRVCDVFVTGDQCKKRWDYLLKMYKDVKDHNSKSGNDRKDMEYYDEMEQILSKKHVFDPPSLASNLSGFQLLQTLKENEKIEGNEENKGNGNNFFDLSLSSTSKSGTKRGYPCDSGDSHQKEKITENFLGLPLLRAKTPIEVKRYKSQSNAIQSENADKLNKDETINFFGPMTGSLFMDLPDAGNFFGPPSLNTKTTAQNNACHSQSNVIETASAKKQKNELDENVTNRIEKRKERLQDRVLKELQIFRAERAQQFKLSHEQRQKFIDSILPFFEKS